MTWSCAASDKEAALRWNNVGELCFRARGRSREIRASAALTLPPAARDRRARRTADPKLRARGDSQVPDSPPSPKAATGLQKRHVVRQGDQVITGTSPTERAPSISDGDGRADNIPPSAAWGATHAEPGSAGPELKRPSRSSSSALSSP